MVLMILVLGSNNYYMSFEYAVELSVNDLVIDFSLNQFLSLMVA